MTDSKSTLKDLIDSLGKVKAKMANLAQDEEVIKGMIKSRMDSQHLHAYEGRLYRCTVSTYSVTNVDYRAVVEELPQSAKLKKLVAEYSKTEERTTVRVASRTGEK